MNPKFHAAVHQRDDVSYVKLGGVIDEDNELGDLTDRIPAGTVVIDLSEIERINSCGVRDWVNWLTKVEKGTSNGGSSRVVLVECSPAIVSQINLVNNFTGTGVVKSFYAPYYCPNCDREKVLLIEASEMGPPPHRAPTCRCDECDGVMDFDDMEDSYFAFLGTSKKLPEAARISAVMSELAGDNEKSKIRSRVGSSQVSVAPSA
jgi:anti-anti-sigma regulatory factor